MIPERWQQVKDILQEALQVAPQQRKSFLDSACSGDQALREEVESLLLEERAGTEGFPQSPLGFSLEDVLCDMASWVGRRIGSYEIMEIIGEGGMGSVYRATRADEQYQKQVAIKIVKLGLGTPFALARFRAERQILANLEHPNIARLLDGGATENGLPYVVMELIEGQPIDEYCNTHRLIKGTGFCATATVAIASENSRDPTLARAVEVRAKNEARSSLKWLDLTDKHLGDKGAEPDA